MIHYSNYNPKTNHHIKPFREGKFGRVESFVLVMNKYIPLMYELNMIETRKLLFDIIKNWEDVYENLVDKEEISLFNPDGLYVNKSNGRY